MIRKFKKYPAVLQKQIIFQFIGGSSTLIASIVLFCYTQDFYLSLPIAIISTLLLLKGTNLYISCRLKRYIKIEGLCCEIYRSKIRRLVKALYLETDNGRFKIITHKHMCRINIGDKLCVYVLYKTPIYEDKSMFIICNCLAMENKNATDDKQKSNVDIS